MDTGRQVTVTDREWSNGYPLLIKTHSWKNNCHSARTFKPKYIGILQKQVQAITHTSQNNNTHQCTDHNNGFSPTLILYS